MSLVRANIYPRLAQTASHAERLDPDPEFWEGKRGACVGVFQQVIAQKAPTEDLRDILTMVRNTSNPQVEYMVRIITKWASMNSVKL